MRKLGLEQTWEPIDDIIDEGSKKAENIINIAYNRDLPFYDRVNILNSTLNFILNNKAFYFENQNNDGDETQKEYDNFLNNLDFKDSKEMNFRSINGKIQSLMEINLKYQKIEMLAHKMASHQFLVKSYRYQEVLEALQSITIRDKFSERKLEIIISVFDNIGKDLVKSVNSMKSINKAFEILPQITFSLKNFDYSNDDVMAFDYKNEPELFCYKYIIESTVYIQNLWKTTTEDLLQEKQNKELVSNISKSLERYRELYGLHMYMNTLSLKNIIYEKEDGKVTDFNANIKNKLDSYVLEVDGVISKLENFIQEKYETIQDNHSVADVSNSELENDSKILLFPA